MATLLLASMLSASLTVGARCQRERPSAVTVSHGTSAAETALVEPR